MTLKEQIRLALGIDKPETKLAYQDKLVDGTIITTEADALEAGVSVSVLTEDGTTMPLPVGKYETETGIGFSVEEEGIVAEIYDEETETEETEEVETEEVEEVEASEEEVVSVNAEKEELSKKVAELEKAPAVAPEKMSKFSKDNPVKSVSPAKLREMSTQERYWHNLSQIKK